MRVPKNGWFISWNVLVKWMMTGGTPISGNLHIYIYIDEELMRKSPKMYSLTNNKTS